MELENTYFNLLPYDIIEKIWSNKYRIEFKPILNEMLDNKYQLDTFYEKYIYKNYMQKNIYKYNIIDILPLIRYIKHDVVKKFKYLPKQIKVWEFNHLTYTTLRKFQDIMLRYNSPSDKMWIRKRKWNDEII